MSAACSEHVRELHTWFTGKHEGRNHFNPLAMELDIQIVAHHLCKM